MKRPDDEVLLRDMLDNARRALAAVSGRNREDLETDPVLAQVWAAEAERRYDTFKAGELDSFPGPEVHREILDEKTR